MRATVEYEPKKTEKKKGTIPMRVVAYKNEEYAIKMDSIRKYTYLYKDFLFDCFLLSSLGTRRFPELLFV